MNIADKGSEHDIRLQLPLSRDSASLDANGCLPTADARLHPNDISDAPHIPSRTALQFANTPVYAFSDLSEAETLTLLRQAGDTLDTQGYTLQEFDPVSIEDPSLDRLKPRSWDGQEAAFQVYYQDNYAPKSTTTPALSISISVHSPSSTESASSVSRDLS